MQLIESSKIKDGFIIKKKNAYEYIHISREEAKELTRAKLIVNYGCGFYAFRKHLIKAFEDLKERLERAKLYI